MTDVVLVRFESIESEAERYRYSAPLGILYLADSLEKAGFTVRLVHEEGNRTNIQKLVDLVSEENPVFVGFSTFTAPTIIPTIQASIEIKAKRDIPVVWGGYHPTISPEQTLMNDFIDLVAIGEGEITVVELTHALREHGLDTRELAKIAGIGFKRNGQAVFTEPRPFIQDLDSVDLAWHLLDIERYVYSGAYFYSGLQGERVIAHITSRGCPWRCGYCFNQAVNKRRFRAQSAQRAISDILELKERLEITGIRFEDENFFTNKQRAFEIVRGIDLAWASTMRANDLAQGGDDFVRALKESNCVELRVGVESGSQRILDLITKDITVDQVRQTAELCGKHGVRAVIMFMYGFPGETWSDICQTLDLIDELETMGEFITVSHLGLFTPYPGTPLFDVAVREGFEPPTSLQGWGAPMGEIAMRKGHLPPYVDKRVGSLNHYRQLVARTDLDRVAFSLPVKTLQQLARWRWKHRFFSFPVDHTIPAAVRKGFDRSGLSAIRKTLYAKLQ